MRLSLYLYGELDFAEEEQVEQHLDECAFCQTALARENRWHGAVNAEHVDVPIDLLAECRRDLKSGLSPAGTLRLTGKRWTTRWLSWVEFLNVAPSRWSAKVAFASFLLMLGFGAGRFLDLRGLSTDGVTQAGLLDAANVHIRDIQPRSGGRVSIVWDQVRQNEIVGQLDDADVRRLLLAAMKDPVDPGVRVDSAEILKDQTGNDVRDALLYAVQHDPNAAVRLKALEGLQQFMGDPETRQSLTLVLVHDDNPGVRSQAIDLLAPANNRIEFNPELAGALREAIRSEPSDDYVRMRCLQVLSEMKSSVDIY
jgi:hypothetical protein